MADFSASDLYTAAVARYRQDVLRNRMRGAAGNSNDADKELLRLANATFSQVAAAASTFFGWPLSGLWPAGSVDQDGSSDISGKKYSEVWPFILFQKALELFNWKTLAGLENVSIAQQKVGASVEAWFSRLSQGGEPLGTGTTFDVGERAPISARDRQGNLNFPNMGGQAQDNVLDVFWGIGWDRSR